ncbi:MAG: DNA replication and repair protein RecF, partial [Chromatiales bacterium]|nr:DNA replication and repair protein RecF [Chromatiales bacterium]
LLFHVEPTYLKHHRRYRRALRQRNAAIRGGAEVSDLGAWDVELAEAGELLSEQRERYLGRALRAMNDVVGALLGRPADIQFYRGWAPNLSLVQACERSLTDDRLRGHTQVGPHRADLRFTICGRPLRHSLSRGEAKLFVTAVAVAQVLDLASVLGYPPVVLVDDIASELDSDSRGRCLAELKATGAQLFLTAVPDVGMGTSGVEAERLFHVERGHIRQMV